MYIVLKFHSSRPKNFEIKKFREVSYSISRNFFLFSERFHEVFRPSFFWSICTYLYDKVVKNTLVFFGIIKSVSDRPTVRSPRPSILPVCWPVTGLKKVIWPLIVAMATWIPSGLKVKAERKKNQDIYIWGNTRSDSSVEPVIFY